MEPMLIEEFTFTQQPKTIRNLIKLLEESKQTSSIDILAGLIYISFLESGFHCIEDINEEEEFYDCSFNYQRILKLSEKLPKDWKCGGVHNFTFILPPFYHQPTKVTCFLVADDLIVNCVVNNLENPEYGHHSTCLDPLLYFLDSNTNLAIKHLQNLKHLSKNIKELSYFAKQDILREHGKLYLCIEALPIEIVLHMVSYLNVIDLVNLGRINNYGADIIKSPKLWLYHLEKDFAIHVNQEERTIWKVLKYPTLRDIYKKMYLNQKRKARVQSQFRLRHPNIYLQNIPSEGDMFHYFEWMNYYRS